jgi:hypothetical protein
LLSVAAFEACSSSTSDSVVQPDGPPVVAFQSLPAAPPYEFGCDNTLVVNLLIDPRNITLRPAYYCGTTPQCGSLFVALFACNPDPAVDPTCTDDRALISARAATASVQLDLSAWSADQLSQVGYVKAELYGDSLHPFVVPAGGVGSVSLPIALTPQGECASSAAAGAGGSIEAGAAGMASSNVGAEAGAGGVANSAGAAGTDSGGTATSGGTAGSGGSASGGTAGTSGTAGTGGDANAGA